MNPAQVRQFTVDLKIHEAIIYCCMLLNLQMVSYTALLCQEVTDTRDIILFIDELWGEGKSGHHDSTSLPKNFKAQGLYIAGRNIKWYRHSGIQFANFFKKLNVQILHSPEIEL